MPPCQRVLRNKIKRANYITGIVKNAVENELNFGDPSKQGWRLMNDKDEYEVCYFDGAQYPEIKSDDIFDNLEETEDFDMEMISINDSEDDEEEEYEVESTVFEP